MANTKPVGNVVWITTPGQPGPEISSYGTDENGEYWERIVDTAEGVEVYNRLAGANEVVGEWEPWNRTPDVVTRRGTVTPRGPRTQVMSFAGQPVTRDHLAETAEFLAATDPARMMVDDPAVAAAAARVETTEIDKTELANLRLASVPESDSHEPTAVSDDSELCRICGLPWSDPIHKTE